MAEQGIKYVAKKLVDDYNASKEYMNIISMKKHQLSAGELLDAAEKIQGSNPERAGKYVAAAKRHTAQYKALKERYGGN